MRYGNSMILGAIWWVGLILAGSPWTQAGSVSLTEARSYTVVSGIARFELRHTLVPLAICETRDCPRVQPYWALILESPGTTYQINQVFAEGRIDAPESVELGSVVIRPGTPLNVEGRVDMLSPEFGVVSDIHKVTLKADSPLEKAPETAISGHPPFYGWICHSSTEPRPLYVDVVQISRDAKKYAIRVEKDPSVLTFNEVEVDVSDTSIRFAGSSRMASVDLSIDPRGTQIDNLDSVLKVKTGMGLEIVERVRCSQTR